MQQGSESTFHVLLSLIVCNDVMLSEILGTRVDEAQTHCTVPWARRTRSAVVYFQLTPNKYINSDEEPAGSAIGTDYAAAALVMWVWDFLGDDQEVANRMGSIQRTAESAPR
jgi:hypothetical protein